MLGHCGTHIRGSCGRSKAEECGQDRPTPTSSAIFVCCLYVKNKIEALDAVRWWTSRGAGWHTVLQRQRDFHYHSLFKCLQPAHSCAPCIVQKNVLALAERLSCCACLVIMTPDPSLKVCVHHITLSYHAHASQQTFVCSGKPRNRTIWV
jgi:hypothetical protein